MQIPTQSDPFAVYHILIYFSAWLRLLVSAPAAIAAFRLSVLWRADLERLWQSHQNGMQEHVLRTATKTSFAFGIISVLFMLNAMILVSRGVGSFQLRGIIDLIGSAILTGAACYVGHVVMWKWNERVKLGELSRRHAQD